jgi:transposase
VLLGHYLERGLSKAEVARELGVSRRTVHQWIATGQHDRELDDAPVRYTERPRRVAESRQGSTQDTMACCMAHSAAAARVDTPILL